MADIILDETIEGVYLNGILLTDIEGVKFNGTIVWTPLPTYTVTFNGNGGEPNEQTLNTNRNGNITILPNVTRSGYDFVEWNTAQDGDGEKITTNTVFTQDSYVYAQWTVPGLTVAQAKSLVPEGQLVKLSNLTIYATASNRRLYVGGDSTGYLLIYSSNFNPSYSCEYVPMVGSLDQYDGTIQLTNIDTNLTADGVVQSITQPIGDSAYSIGDINDIVSQQGLCAPVTLYFNPSGDPNKIVNRNGYINIILDDTNISLYAEDEALNAIISNSTSYNWFKFTGFEVYWGKYSTIMLTTVDANNDGPDNDVWETLFFLTEPGLINNE